MTRPCRTLYRLGIGLILLAIVPIVVQAHESRPAYLEIDETEPGRYSVIWRTPVLAGGRLLVVPRFPDGIRDLREPIVQDLSDSRLERRWIDAGPQGLAGQRIEFPGLQLTITDAVVRVSMLDGPRWMAIARPAQPWVAIEAIPGALTLAGDFLRQGIQHILLGADHLLFVLGLLYIVRGIPMLIRTITAFTVAHSITLSVAALGYASIPGPPLNAAIALSILFLGPEMVRVSRGQTSFTIRHPWVVAFGFGLLHGFGFASGLATVGMPKADIPLALLMFNIGVELGQLCFVALILFSLRAARTLEFRWPRRAALAPAYLIGSLGAFWTIQRSVIMM